MINSKSIALAILSGCLLFTGDVFAQGEDGPNCNGGPMMGANQRGGGGATQGIGPQETAQRMMSNFDEDGNGALNMQELSNGLAALQQSMMRMQMQRGQQQMQRGGQQMGGQAGNQQQAGGNCGGNQNQAQRSMQRGQGGQAQQMASRMGGGGPRGGGGQRGGGGGGRQGRGR